MAPLIGLALVALLLTLPSLGSGATLKLWSSDSPVLREVSAAPASCPSGTVQLLLNDALGSAQLCRDGGAWLDLPAGWKATVAAAPPTTTDACRLADLWLQAEHPGAETSALYLCEGEEAGEFLWRQAASSLDISCAVGPQCGFTALTSTRPLIRRDGPDEAAVRIEEYFEGGAPVTRCRFGTGAGEPCHPAPIRIPIDRSWPIEVETVVNGVPTWLPYLTITNPAGVPAADPAGRLCTVLPGGDGTSAFDNVPFGYSPPWPYTVTAIGCRYHGSAPTTAAQFTLNGMTHTAPTCVGPTAAMTPSFQSVTGGGAVAADVEALLSVANTPNPTTDHYTVCLDLQRRLAP